MAYANDMGQAIDQLHHIRSILKSVADELWDGSGDYVRMVPDSQLVHELIRSLRELDAQAKEIEAANG